MPSYLFQSQRLGFRNWSEKDLDEFAVMNADLEVMKHFPKSLTREESALALQKFQALFEEKGYTYYATDLLETGEFIGFIGLADKDFESDFTPAVDIGWRLKKSAWGKGLATEGAIRCLEFGFKTLHLNSIISLCPIVNTGSENVMKKIGMKKMKIFKHPQLGDFPRLQECVLYQIENNEMHK
ncbi:MAG: GNAT family N-acetyltransferase [Saprospiraceae bacterium]